MFTRYMPSSQQMLHFTRTVILPEYTGFGLSQKLIDATSEIMSSKGFDIKGCFSSPIVFRSMLKSPNWRLVAINKGVEGKYKSTTLLRKETVRRDVKSYSFAYVRREVK